MMCFSFSKGEKHDEPKTTKSMSVRSSTSVSDTMRRSGSEVNSRNVSSELSTESSTTTRNSFSCLSQKANDLRVFTFSELKSATKNFSRSLMIGEGGFGGVYRGLIRSSEDPRKKIDIAVKQLSKRGLQARFLPQSFSHGHKEWVTEVNVLGVVQHPNLVKLIGYCAEDDERGIQRLLVYEYMPNRSVQDHLSTRFQATLPWTTRLRIAQDSARGLAYLHEEMEFQSHVEEYECSTFVSCMIIFRDFKSSNILLDSEWNAKLSDFGLARLGPLDGLSHVSTAVVGTVGYAAPEYMQTGRLTCKSDIWSYGVFLYELITGRRPLDRNLPKNEQKLLEWIRPHLTDIKKFRLILDPRLEGNYNLKSAQRLAAIANKCLVRHPKTRPKMSEVLEMINHVVEATETGSPQLPMKSLVAKDSPKRSTKAVLKRRLLVPIIGENGWLVWRTWRAKLVKTC
ncbi:Protein kinase domain [Dillenia turbinata]|uniref:non-specific serine/threonine protein kinase n=1 Tax=Dillenia turbinata TaxID=194707 RepID=A0AAN8ZAV2_9MAGN